MKVLILYETAGGLPEKQLQIVTSPEFASLLNTKCSKNQYGVPEWRFWDDDYTSSQLSGVNENLRAGYLAAQAKAAGKPWMVVSDGKSGESVPLPPDLASAIALVQKFIH